MVKESIPALFNLTPAPIPPKPAPTTTTRVSPRTEQLFGRGATHPIPLLVVRVRNHLHLGVPRLGDQSKAMTPRMFTPSSMSW